jgi:hypothetical protein
MKIIIVTFLMLIIVFSSNAIALKQNIYIDTSTNTISALQPASSSILKSHSNDNDGKIEGFSIASGILFIVAFMSAIVGFVFSFNGNNISNGNWLTSLVAVVVLYFGLMLLSFASMIISFFRFLTHKSLRGKGILVADGLLWLLLLLFSLAQRV